MRISDWSSDVCSSDLRLSAIVPSCSLRITLAVEQCASVLIGCMGNHKHGFRPAALEQAVVLARQGGPGTRLDHRQRFPEVSGAAHLMRQPVDGRSEEHTSELQSLMRISYAVFCLKKKKT